MNLPDGYTWRRKCTPRAVWWEELHGPYWSPTLRMFVPLTLGYVAKMNPRDKFYAYDYTNFRAVGTFYHKTKAKQALVSAIVMSILNEGN